MKASGVSIACEEKMRQIARGITGENLKGEISPFTFPLSSGGEEIRGAPHIFMPNLNDKVIQLLEENYRLEINMHSMVTTQNEFLIH